MTFEREDVDNCLASINVTSRSNFPSENVLWSLTQKAAKAAFGSFRTYPGL